MTFDLNCIDNYQQIKILMLMKGALPRLICSFMSPASKRAEAEAVPCLPVMIYFLNIFWPPCGGNNLLSLTIETGQRHASEQFNCLLPHPDPESRCQRIAQCHFICSIFWLQEGKEGIVMHKRIAEKGQLCGQQLMVSAIVFFVVSGWISYSMDYYIDNISRVGS